VPTGKTSVTAARDVRIDALLFQSQKLMLVDSKPAKQLRTPIPDSENPSDHVPIMATFQIRSALDYHRDCARAWYGAIAGHIGNVPLTREQIRDAFFVFEVDGNDLVSRSEFVTVAGEQLGYTSSEAAVVQTFERAQAAASTAGPISFQGFVQAYTNALAQSGMPGVDDLREAFNSFDKDGSGELDAKEIAAIFQTCSPVALSEGAEKKIFARIDRDGNGTVTIDEFLKSLVSSWVSRNIAAPPEATMATVEA